MLKFEDQSLTSYAGLVVFQELFESLNLTCRLKRCVVSIEGSQYFSFATLLKVFVIHALIGFKKIRDVDLYRDDPIVKRTLGVKVIASVSTISRMLDCVDDPTVSKFQDLVGEIVLDRLSQEALSRVTLDFDGSVIATKRHAEGVACGFNKKKKGQRSYYPLFCTIAQSGQVLDALHRSGNVHDSNGAIEFVRHCLAKVRQVLPKARIEIRMDSAFFSDAMVCALEQLKVQYTISVPFERFAQLKGMILKRSRWEPLAIAHAQSECFQKRWKPKCWKRKARFVFIKSLKAKQSKAPLQLDLFEPRDFEYNHKVIVTNKSGSVRSVARFHEGRGQQENLFAELKSEGMLAYTPARKWNANKLYMLAGILAHNLNRELQMRTWDRIGPTTQKRSPLWLFEKIDTIRKTLILRAGRLTYPQGKATLTLSHNKAFAQQLLNYLAI